AWVCPALRCWVGGAGRSGSAGGCLEPQRLVARQDIDALVVGVTGMALHPAPVDDMAAGGGMQPLPEVAVLHRGTATGLPAATDPAGHPLGDALADVLRVGVEGNLAGLGQRFQ